MLSYLGRSVALEELVKDPNASEEDELFYQRVESIRRFATEELGLKASKNYTRYVSLDRDYLVAVVSACADDSFARHQWWFPVVGRVPYKGFFNVGGAMRERTRLERKNLDVWIGRVDAFSTLGWFSDPLYSFMKNYYERYLADLIIHELLHATVWISGHSQFNEELAEFVGSEGSRLYMERRYGTSSSDTDSDAAKAGENAALADSAAFQAFIRSLIADLDELYKLDISREEKLIRKEEIIENAKNRFDENYDEHFITDNYRHLGSFPINNAYLSLFMLYHEEDHFYKDLYERSGSDLQRFISAATTLSARPGRGYDPKLELERALR